MIEVSGGAKWYFGFDMLGSMRGGGIDFTCAETVVDFIDSETDALGAVDSLLVEGHLCARLPLQFVESDADNAGGAR